MFYIFTILFIVLLVAIDQLTKYLAIVLLTEDIPLISNILELHYTENTGCAWSMFSNATIYLVIFTSVLLLAIAIFLFSGKIRGKLPVVSLCLIFSGGLGNLIDRVFRGYVIDFIYVKCINFPIFNIADSFVCIGACLLLIYVIFFSDNSNEKKRGKQNGEETLDCPDGENGREN